MRKYVVTGGPGCGKTTVVEELKSMGCPIIPEVGRYLIESEIQSGGKCLPWVDREAFQNRILEIRLKIENTQEVDSNFIVLDRGIPDGIAYYIFDNLQPPKDLVVQSQHCEYRKVFWLAPLRSYKRDSIRKYSKQDVEMLGKILLEVYTEFGFDIVKLPLTSVTERVATILKYIENDS